MASDTVMFADVDTEPPELIEFDFNPKSVNAGLVDHTITLRFRITDDLSGFNSGQMQWLADNGEGGGNVMIYPSGAEAGDVYESRFHVPRFDSPKTRTVAWLNLIDGVGNMRTMTKDDFVALGFPVTLTVTNAVEKLYIPLVVTIDAGQ